MTRELRRWTESELQYLRTHYGWVTTKQLAHDLDREVTAVSRKVWELKIRSAWRQQLTQDITESADPLLYYLRTAPVQPKLPQYSWSAFDTARLLLLHGVVADTILAPILGRKPEALYARRTVLRWNRKAALTARQQAKADPAMLALLQSLQGSGQIALPERLLTLLYPRGLYETYLRRRYPTPDPTNSADMPSTAATD